MAVAPLQNYVSVSRRPPDVEDYIDMLRRYRSWVIGPTFAGLVISVVVAFLWPDTFRSSAIMQIRPQSVPSNMVTSVISGQMQERLQAMQVEILGRGFLTQLIQRPALDLYKRERNRLPVEDIAERMGTKDIKIRLVGPPGTEGASRGATAFSISFEYIDKYKAQAVVNELVNQFMTKNFTLQQDRASQTNTFLTDELRRAKEKMDAKQAEIAKFTAENQGRLPENYQSNQIDLTSKENQINALDEQIGQERQRKLVLETQLAGFKAQEVAAQNNVEQTQVTGNVSVKNQRLVDLHQLISNKQLELSAALRKYKEDYPDVQALKDQIKTLQDAADNLEKADLAAASQQGPQTRVTTNQQVAAQIEGLRGQEQLTLTEITNSQNEIDRKTKLLDDLRKELRVTQDRLAASPAIIQQYNALQQDFALAKDEYDQKTRNKNQADSAQNLEEHKAGETLEVIEPANVPESAFEPNRPAITAVGTLIGLMLGLALAGAKEIKNTSLKNLKDVRAYTNLPVLSSIPLLENALLVRRKRRLAWLAWSSAVIVGSILMCGAAYYHLSGGPGPS